MNIQRLGKMISAGVALALMFVLVAPIVPVLVARADGGPMLSVTAAVTVPGAPASIAGSGFSPGETVHITFGTQTADVVANSGGSISGASLPIPMVPTGLQFISGFGETSGHWALAYLWVAGYAPAVTPSTWYVLPGQPLSFTGTGFAPNESINLTYNSMVLASSTTDASGSFSMWGASLPLSLHNTQATLTFHGAISNSVLPLTLTIGQLSPSITPSAWYTAPGSVISVSGLGFAPNENITVVAGTRTTSTTANSSGAFVVGALTLPSTSGSSVAVTATGASSLSAASASISLATLSPWLTFSTYWAQGGSALTIFGNGFAGGESVALASGAQQLGTTTANGSGAFSFSSAVPFALAGPVTIIGTGQGSAAVGSGQMTVAPVYTSLTLGSYAIVRGTALEIIGHGYLPNEPVQITTSATGSTVVLNITADVSGNFDNSNYIVPASTTPGNLTVTAEGVHSFDQKSVTLYVGQ